jgi:hypothetical protein
MVLDMFLRILLNESNEHPVHHHTIVLFERLYKDYQFYLFLIIVNARLYHKTDYNNNAKIYRRLSCKNLSKNSQRLKLKALFYIIVGLYFFPPKRSIAVQSEPNR